MLVLLPAIVAWSMGLYDAVVVRQTQHDLRKIGDRLSEEIATRALSAADVGWLDALGKKHDVMIRILDEEGGLLSKSDPTHADGRIGKSWWFRRAADFFFGPEGPPDLITFEAEIGPEARRPEVARALAGSPSETWREASGMFVFYRAVPLSKGGALYLTRLSRRNVRELYDFRYQLLKLTLGLMVGALLMGLYMGWDVVSPLRRLQLKIREHMSTGRSTSLALDRQDEIGDLSRDFDALTQRLQDKLTETVQVTGDFAHDLKNPIATISASAELLLNDASKDQARRERIAKAISGASEHLRRSVDAMLSLARLDEGLLQETHAPVDLTKLITDVVDRYQEDPAVAVAIVSELEPRLMLDGNAERLEELLQNLLDNAQVFARERILVRAQRVAEGIELAVSDDGPGVSEGNREKIFLRFFTHRPSGKERSTGLGLNIVARIAEAHRGEVELDPIGASGATFRVRFRTTT